MKTAPAIALALASCGAADPDPAALGLKWVAEKREPSGFVVGGKNPTSLVKTLAAVNGRSVAELEADMRPGAASQAGFLGPGESLTAVLAADNAYVVDELGLTHQALARALRVIGAVGRREAQAVGAAGSGHEFTYRGRRLRVKVVQFRGYQVSPFRDDTRTDTDVTVENLDTGKSLKYSLLVPDMVERYGFYEGRGTPYRVDPRDVLAVLDFLQPKK